MKKIQQKLREILGNTSRVAKHLASGNLPDRRDVVKVWSEATGIIYKGNLATGSGSVGLNGNAENTLYVDPYNVALSGVVTSGGVLTVKLLGVPNIIGNLLGRLNVSITEGENYQGLGLLCAYGLKGVGYNVSTGEVSIELQVVDVITHAVVDLTLNDISFFLTLYYN